MSQTKKQSLIESFIDVGLGLLVSIVLTNLMFPIIGIDVTFNQSFIVVTMFTIASVIRKYFIRRAFNYFYEKRR